MNSLIHNFCLRVYNKLLLRVFVPLGNKYYPSLKETGKFEVQGKKYPYFFHSYNKTWMDERSVELPIVWAKVEEALKNNLAVLEVGNVLNHYFEVKHTVIDKYERGKGVINVDAVDYKPEKLFDLIISISTIEHVGWDEEDKDSKKILILINRLKQMLKSNGQIMITVPVGFNPDLDKFLKNGQLAFDEAIFLKRLGNHHWVQSSAEEVLGLKFGGFPHFTANGLVIGLIKKN